MNDRLRRQALRAAALAACTAGAARADVNSYLVQLQYNHAQDGPASIAPTSFAFFAALNAGPGDVGTARIASPGTAGEETMSDLGDGSFQYGEVFDNEAALFDAYGPGLYTFTVFGGAAGFGFGDAPIYFPVRYPSAAPAFDAATWTAMQAVDPAADLVLHFNTFTTAMPDARAAVQIVIEATAAGVFYAELPASQGTVTIPAGTLAPQIRYTALLYFIGEEAAPFAGFDSATAYSQIVSITTAPLSTSAPCPGDLNGDGLVDFADYLEFLNRYDAQDPSVDFNQDGQVDFADYLEFLNLYDAGC